MYTHVRRLDISNQGIGEEVAIMKEDSNGDIYFIKTEHLDEIDYARLAAILRKKEARLMPLWDLLSSIKLNNGMNALIYFHQFVMVKTASGQLMKPNPRRSGMPLAQRNMAAEENARVQRENANKVNQPQAFQPETAQPDESVAPRPVKNLGGRPRKNK